MSAFFLVRVLLHRLYIENKQTKQERTEMHFETKMNNEHSKCRKLFCVADRLQGTDGIDNDLMCTERLHMKSNSKRSDGT